jgi:hypothetical protein
MGLLENTVFGGPTKFLTIRAMKGIPQIEGKG